MENSAPQALLCNTGDDDVLSMRLFSNVGAGNEICNTYGEMNNAGLLLTRGFCVHPATGIEVVNLKLEEHLLPEVSAMHRKESDVRRRLEFLQTYVTCFGPFFTLSGDDPVPHALLVAARVLVMRDHEYSVLLRNSRRLGVRALDVDVDDPVFGPRTTESVLREKRVVLHAMRRRQREYALKPAAARAAARSRRRRRRRRR